MLVQYAVENYKSIRDEIVINFSVDKKFYASNWAIAEENIPIPLYKCIGLLGPNASGKSNIIKSFNFAFRFILNTVSRKETSKIDVERFAFGDCENEKPTSFEFIFYQNKVKYVYGFSVNENEVVYEYLMGYFSAKPKMLFDRSAGQQYEFKGNDVKEQTEMAKKTNANRLYMPVAAEWGYVPLKVVYEWFQFHARQFETRNTNYMIWEIVKREERKKNLVSQLQKADFNIKDIYIRDKKIDQKSYDIIELFFEQIIGKNEEYTIPDTTPIIHVVHESGQGKVFDIALDEDSTGTASIVKTIAEFLYLSEYGGFMVEDELGKDYHTKLTQHFLQMFKSSDLNPGNVQLLFSTHDTKVLNILNPDQIYLVDKDEAGATVVKLLDDYVIREKDNIELGYLKGRYGSIPYMKG